MYPVASHDNFSLEPDDLGSGKYFQLAASDLYQSLIF